ncbi:MAG TPA: beta-propeller domain-containing protein, partial [Acidimicrobiia bacterium]|nr:beta-propeller domain-containing protein [Acidimicrobiia bacterium]
MRRTIILLTAIALSISACAGVGTVGNTTTTTNPPGIFGAELHSFNQCDDLLDYYISQALPLIGPYGLPGYGPYGPVFLEEDSARLGAVAPTASQASGSVDYSGTNVQVAGVDEADIVKTDGRRIFALVNGTLQIAIPTSDGVTIAGSLELR